MQNHRWEPKSLMLPQHMSQQERLAAQIKEQLNHPHSHLLLHPIKTETPTQAPPTPEIQWEEEGAVAIILEQIQEEIRTLCQVDRQEEVEGSHHKIQWWLQTLKEEKMEALVGQHLPSSMETGAGPNIS
jgi:hypothetical protein